MKDKHKKIKGYRELSQGEINLMNKAKELAEECGELIEHLDSFSGIDKRWLNIGKTDLQKGFMGVIRSIARQTTF